MKNRSKNKLHHMAAGIFLLGLITNVSLSVTDPFIFVDTDVISQISGSSGSGSSSSSSGESTDWWKAEQTEQKCKIILGVPPLIVEYEGFIWKCVDGPNIFCTFGCRLGL